jgi:hypothetical protein
MVITEDWRGSGRLFCAGEDDESNLCDPGAHICLHDRDGGYDCHCADRIMKRFAAERHNRGAVSSTASLRYAAFLVLGIFFLTALWATVHTRRVPAESTATEAVAVPNAIVR